MLFSMIVNAQTTYYSKATATDFNDVNSWGTNTDGSGTVPTSISNVDNFIIQNAATLSLSANATVRQLTINSGNLNHNANTLTISRATGNNSTLLISGGALNVSATASIVLNGNLSMTSGSFNQSGGTITIDGNDNNVIANSVVSGTALVSFASNNVTLSGGTMIIVDPHAGTATETGLRYSPTTSPYPTVTSGHTMQFGDGVSTTTGGSLSGFRITQGTRLSLGNVVVNTLSGRYVFSSGNIPILGNLTITNGEFQIQSGQINAIAGNIVNNGTLSTIGTLYFGTYTLPSTLAPTNNAQTVSGNGVFRNATTSTANFASITVNNTNAAGVTFSNANSLLSGTNTGTVSGTLTFTAGTINTGANEFILGISTASVGSLAHTAGGFGSGSKMTRWIGTATGGTTITASTLPSFAGTGSFPFINSSNGLRVLALQQTAAATTGGKLSVVYNASAGTSPTSIVDGTYTVETRSNDSWTVSQSGITGTPTYSIALCAQNIYSAINGNSHVTLASAPALGTHQAGTTYPVAQRIAIPLANLSDTYYLGASNVDIPFQSIASGNWEDASTWNKGVAPSCTDAVVISNSHIVTVNANAGNCQSLTINTGGILAVNGSTLSIGCTLNNNTLTNNGTLTVTAGQLNINGNLNCVAGSTFNQSGGDINIDGNGGASGTNVASGTALCQLNSQFINWTGGTLTIIDPHAATTATNTFAYNNSTAHVNITSGHTFRLGDGISTDAGGNATNGFRINTWVGSNRISFNNFEVNALSGTNRHVSTTYGYGINGNLSITSGEFRDNASTIYVAQSLINNGTYISTGVLYLGTYLSGTVAASSNTQTISGSGIFSNNATIGSKTADLTSMTINNTNSTGVTIDRNLSLSGTLTMTSGITTVNTGYVLQLGSTTAAGTLSGTQSATNMIRGTFARTFAASRTATGTYSAATLYPLGAGTSYLPIWIDPSTASTGASAISATAFDSNTGTTGVGIANLASVRYEYSNTAANLNNAFFRVRPTVLNNATTFLQSTSASGVYDFITGVSSTVASPNLTSSAIPVSSMTGFLSTGELIPCTAPTDQATNWTNTAIGTTTLSASFSAATSNPSGYLVVRYPTGSTPTNPVDLTSYSTGNTLGTGTVVQSGTSTLVNATGLTANTTYDFYVYSYNNSGCAGPIYNVSSPLLATVTTCASAVTAPTSSAGTAISASGFTANWTASTTVGVTDYYVDVSTSSTFATLLAGYPVNAGLATNYVIIGLNPNTTYYYRVRANVGLCASANSTSQTVITDCAPELAPTTVQPFTTYTPACWKEATGALTTSTVLIGTTSAWAAETGFGNTGSNPAVRINLYSTKNDWIISQPIDLGAGGYRIKYNMAVTSYLGTTAQSTLGTHKVDIVVSTDAGQTWSNANIVKTYTGAGTYSSTGQIETIDLVGYTGIVKIGFLATTTSTSPDIDFHIDDFEVVQIPPCANPTALNTTNVSATSVAFAWTAPSSGNPPNSYNWEIRTSGAGGSGTTGLVESGNSATTFANSTTGLLSPTTSYNIYVQSDCGSGSTSTWAGPLTFTTPCAAISTLPWTEGFEGITTVGTNAFPSCWKEENGDWQSANAGTNTYNNPRTGSNYITDTYSATNEWMWTPPFDLIAGVEYNFKFWFVGDGYSGWTGDVGVNSNQVSTGATILGSPFISSATTSSATNYQEVINSFTPTTNGTYYFGIRINATSTPWYIGFDDFTVEIAPTCKIPSALIANIINANDVSFSWNAPTSGNTPTGYNWEIRTSGAGGSGATGLVDSGNSATTSANSTTGLLLANTNYNIYVQTDCGGGNTSNWIGPLAITTPCANVTLPINLDFEGSTTLTNCWRSSFVSGTKAFSIGTSTTAAGTSPNPAAQQGTNRLLFPSYTNNGNQTRLISPPINASAVSSIDVKFQWYESTTGGATLYLTEGVQIQYSLDGINWTNTGSLYRRYGATTGWFAKKEVITGNQPIIYIGFLFTSNAGYDAYLDDVKIEETPVCSGAPLASSVSASASSVCAGSNVILNATGLDNVNANISYQWQSSDNAGASWNDIFAPVVNAATSSVTVTGLTVNTSFRLLGACTTSGIASTPSNVVNVDIATVTGGTTSATNSMVCSSTTTSNTTLSLTGVTAGVSYQWQSSTNGTAYTDISGATAATFNATVSATTYFQCVVTCGASTATSAPITITLRTATQCYCVPASSGSSCIQNVTIGTINNNTPTACTAPYYSQQSATTNLVRGTAVPLSVTTNGAGIISVWIDYNQNGTFEASEWQQVTTASTSGVASTINVNIPSTATLGTTGMRIRSRSTGSANGSGDACTQFFSGECEDYYVTIIDATPKIAAKVYLGNYNGTMDDYLRNLTNFPISDPYNAAPLNTGFTHVNPVPTVSTTPLVLSTSGNDAIVDWVFIELRTGVSGATTVAYTRSALLQKDGDIVDVDGTSPVSFPNTPNGNYYVTIRHRNHTGFRTANTVALSSNVLNLNFTDNSVALFGSFPTASYSAAIQIMNGGDSNFDGSIDAFDTIIWENQNGLFDDYQNNSDYNLDGSVDAFDSIMWELNNGKYQELD